MTTKSGQTKFEAMIRNSLYDAMYSWVQDRGKLSNTQIGEAMFRLFLAAPGWVKVLALVLSLEELRDLPPDVWRVIADALKPPEARTSPEPQEPEPQGPEPQGPGREAGTGAIIEIQPAPPYRRGGSILPLGRPGRGGNGSTGGPRGISSSAVLVPAVWVRPLHGAGDTGTSSWADPE